MAELSETQRRIAALSGGNIGALAILLESFAPPGGDPIVGTLLVTALEERGIKGEAVWCLSKLARRHPRRTLELVVEGEWIETIRAMQSGDEDARLEYLAELDRVEGITDE